MKLVIEFDQIDLKEQERLKNLLFMEVYLNKKVHVLSKYREKIKSINIER